MAFTSESFDETLARRKRAQDAFPELQYSTPTQIAEVDGAYPDRLPTSFTQQAVRLANYASEPTPDQPDNAPNVLPWTTQGPLSGGGLDYFNKQDVVNAPTGAGDNAPSAPPWETLGKVGSFLTGTLAPEGSNLVEQELLRPANYIGAGGGLTGLARGALSGIGARLGAEYAPELLPADAPDWARTGASLIGGLVGGGAGFGAVGVARGVIPRAKTWMELANQALDDVRGAKAKVAKASQIGRAPNTDSLFTAGPQGEVVGPTGNVAEMRLGREPVMGEDVNAGLRRTAYGRAQQDALATEEQAAFRDAGERAISGAVGGETLPPLGGGAAERPQFTIDDLNAVIAEKKAAGLTPEQIFADPQVQAYQREVFKLDAPRDFNAPENLGGGVPLTPEQQANVSGTVQRAGQLNTIRDSLANAREQAAAPRGEPFSATVYHGAAPEVNEVRVGMPAGRRGENPTSQWGAFFTPDQSDAARYAEMATGGGRPGNVIAANVTLDNPYRMSRSEFNSFTNLDLAKGDLEGQMAALKQQAAAFKQQLLDQGYDGIIIGDQKPPRSGYAQQEIVAFNDAQIAHPPTALDKVIARTADTLPEPNRTQPPPGYLDRFRQPPAGGAEETRGEIPATPTQGASPGMEVPQVKEPLTQRALRIVTDLGNLPRTLQSSVDLSGSLRQAGFLGPRHYREWKDAVVEQAKALVSEDSARRVQQEIENAPMAKYRKGTSLYQAAWDGSDLDKREEQFLSSIASNLPGVKQSGRAYATLLNKFRADIFDNVVAKWPEEARTTERLEQYAKYVNAATGRGSLPEALKGLAPAMNALFFSPRFLASIPQRHLAAFTTDPLIRNEVVKDLGAFYGTGLTVLGSLYAAKRAGLLPDVEINFSNPDDPDWGKVKVGNTRIDIWGGQQQFARMMYRVVTNAPAYAKAYATGNASDVKSGENPFNIASQFLRYKFSPIANLEEQLRTGKTAIGEPAPGPAETAIREVTPLFFQDLYDAYGAGGAKAAALTAPASILGIGAQTYSDTGGGVTARPVRPSRPKRPTRPTR